MGVWDITDKLSHATQASNQSCEDEALDVLVYNIFMSRCLHSTRVKLSQVMCKVRIHNRAYATNTRHLDMLL